METPNMTKQNQIKIDNTKIKSEFVFYIVKCRDEKPCDICGGTISHDNYFFRAILNVNLTLCLKCAKEKYKNYFD
jgi:hypothetical protein